MPRKQPTDEERPIPSTFKFGTLRTLGIEKQRVACDVRLAHLSRDLLKAQVAADPELREQKISYERQGDSYVAVKTDTRQQLLPAVFYKDVDAFTYEVDLKLRAIEDSINAILAADVRAHPAYHWFNRVKGVGDENMAKVLGFILIERAPTMSSLWKFAGFFTRDGETAAKPIPKEKLDYCKPLHTMCWRLSTNLMKAGGKYYDYYLQQKERIERERVAQGLRIIPTPPLSRRVIGEGEPEGIFWQGHLHNQAIWKMMILFLGNLWLVWRQAVDLPVRDPYVIEKLGHTTIIDPWEMVDK